MKTYAQKPDKQPRTLDSSASASRQASITDILQTYTYKTSDAAPFSDKSEDGDKNEIHPMVDRSPSPPTDENKENSLQKVENRTGLPDELKVGMEALSGFCMDDVRVHYNSSKPAQLQALAYTQGTNIHVAPGQEKYLPHEVWHVIQQKERRVQPTLQLQGITINDNKELEKEADQKGEEAMQLKGKITTDNKKIEYKKKTNGKKSVDQPPINKKENGYLNSLTIQRVVQIGTDRYEERDRQTLIEQIIDHFSTKMGTAIPQEINLYIQQKVSELCEESGTYPFRDLNEFINLIEFQINTQEELKRALPTAEEWWNHPDTEGFFTLNKEDPWFKQLSDDIMRNHMEQPYSTDALHETGPIMQPYMKGETSQFISQMISSLFQSRKDLTDRPDFEITRILMIKNKKFLAEYERAREDIEGRTPPNEKQLYSGHGETGMDFISVHGHDPSFGQFDSRKGHGAHGRGSYFTGQVDKAISYSSSGQKPEEERSFFAQNVLLGNSFSYKRRGRFRFNHHDEMVKTARSLRNKKRREGVSYSSKDKEILPGCDSLTGKKTSTPGNALIGTIIDRSKFDSEEYMVRNADQVYVQFRIFYKLRSPQQAPMTASSSVIPQIPPPIAAPPRLPVQRPIIPSMFQSTEAWPKSRLGGVLTNPMFNPSTIPQPTNPLMFPSARMSQYPLPSPLKTECFPQKEERVFINGNNYTIAGHTYNSLDNSGEMGMCLWNIFRAHGISDEILEHAANEVGITYAEYVDVSSLENLVNAINRIAQVDIVINLVAFDYEGNITFSNRKYGSGKNTIFIGLIHDSDGMGHYVEAR